MATPILPIQKRSVAWTFSEMKQSDILSDGSSTSAGSSSLASPDRDEWGLASPVNWRIRNTFLDTPFLKLTLMQGFQRSRRSWSCPAGGREAAEREDLVAFSERLSPSAETPVRAQDACVERLRTTPEHTVPRPLA